MIYTLHNNEDLIYAYVTFLTVDEFGKAKNEGLYIHISDIWINSSYRNRDVLKELIFHIDNHIECKNAKFVYWRREKYNRISKTYSRDRLSKMGDRLCQLFQ